MDANSIGHSTSGALTGKEIADRLDKDLFIRPLLEVDKQINELGIDFRLGCDFLVSLQGREAFINASLNGDRPQRNIHQFFQPTRRQLGETFILYPHQTILATSLEYLKMPDNLFLMLMMRSSYARLGLTISTIVQPGYCGCISLELTNNNRNSINLTVGARVFQAIFFNTEKTQYYSKERKYICQVRPEPSGAIKDQDLGLLHELWCAENNRTPNKLSTP
ncbi:dCTP deaminase [Chitinophaga sp. CB10]|uniref:dCTP deaminase n=1 Tax=Chitinophaga sp. CB10 TaxID=1891659 RepID=UPI0025C2B8D2|nr:dCTP deaminase [Chitinophaga sp. CB10]